MKSAYQQSIQLPTIGLLGGMSPESTADYYRRINDGVREQLGGFRSARLMIFSADLQEVFQWIYGQDFEALARYLVHAAKGLEAAGATKIAMACNTAHQVAPQIEEALNVPFIHIADVLAQELKAKGKSRVGLLASRVTAEATFYRDRLAQHGIEVVTPDEQGRATVDRVIREELCFHRFLPESHQAFECITAEMAEQGADSVALACTEIGLLIREPVLASLPVFDTTAIHCRHLVAAALPKARHGSKVA